MKKILQLLTHRVFLMVLLMLIQAAVLFEMIWRFSQYFVYFYGVCSLLGIIILIRIVNSRSNPAYKLAWAFLILPFPVFGGLLYLISGRIRITNKKRQTWYSTWQKAHETLKKSLTIDPLFAKNRKALNQSHYIAEYSFIPPFRNTYTKYLPQGEIKFACLKEELEKAEHYIFLEYFIIQEGVMWDSILEILARKAAQGVDVRVIYDDMGCMLTLPYNYPKKLKEMGIKCCVFNPFIPVLSTQFNNRDHRKIAVIDGITGITGGINLADEYINAFEKHGHWKDTAILLRGEGVWGLTLFFLTTWDYLCVEEKNYTAYKPDYSKVEFENRGYVQPYVDDPLDFEPVGENIYINLLNKSENYVYITTPYLVLDNEMLTAISMAAKNGIDVRIITPHIPDHWYVHAVSKYYYELLIKDGVKIYEYTPGFIHAKSFVADDQYAVVGTVNLDYRSLHLHYECGVWLYNTDSVLEVRDDFLQTLQACQQITLADCLKVPWPQKVMQSILRIFAPLM